MLATSGFSSLTISAHPIPQYQKTPTLLPELFPGASLTEPHGEIPWSGKPGIVHDSARAVLVSTDDYYLNTQNILYWHVQLSPWWAPAPNYTFWATPSLQQLARPPAPVHAHQCSNHEKNTETNYLKSVCVCLPNLLASDYNRS